MASLVKSVLFTDDAVGVQCRCGALIRYIHCSGCGSTNFYAKSSASVTMPFGADATNITLRGFHCRRCDIDFFDGQPCEAPFFENENVKKRREEEHAQQKVVEAQQACYKECAERGMTQQEATMEWVKRLLKIRQQVGGLVQ